MEYWVLYLCGIATSIGVLFRIFGVLGLIFGLVIFVMNMCTKGCERCSNTVCLAKSVTACKVKGGRIFISGLIALFIGCAIPKTKDCYAIFGVGSVLHYVNHSEQAQKIPDNALKAVNYYLESFTPKDSIR